MRERLESVLLDIIQSHTMSLGSSAFFRTCERQLAPYVYVRHPGALVLLQCDSDVRCSLHVPQCLVQRAFGGVSHVEVVVMFFLEVVELVFL